MKLGIFLPIKVIKIKDINLTESYVPYQFEGFKKLFSHIDLIVFHSELKKNIKIPMYQKINEEAFNIIKLPFPKNGLDLYFKKILILLWHIFWLFYRNSCKWNAIIIYEFSILSQLVLILCKIFKIPSFIWIGGFELTSVRTKLRFVPLYLKIPKLFFAFQNYIALRLMAKLATGVIVTGNSLKEYFKNFIPEDKIYNFIATGARVFDIEPQLPDLRKLRLNKKIKILTVCRITATKGIEFLIQAVSLLNKRKIPFSLIIVGPFHDIDYIKRLRLLVNKLGLSDVNFIGEIQHGEKLNQFYREADIFVLPSLTEGTPKVIAEAMAKGLPIIATNVGGISELVKHEVNGLLVPPRNYEKLFEALLRLIFDPELRYQMGKNALKIAPFYTIDYQIGLVSQWIMQKIEKK